MATPSSPPPGPVAIHDETSSADNELEPLAPCDPEDPDKPAPFDYLTENLYISKSLHVSKDRKRAKRMVCECQFDPEMDELDEACGENCLNRLLMIECSSRCPCGEYCTNKRFQRADYANVEVFKTESKGWGLRACKDLPPGEFVMEYCGEVCTPSDFEQRKVEYVREKRRHYYFMSLKTDEILDATRKGNYSRYINHSCDPNCETQKWTVNGRLRIGFFSVKSVQTNEELTFDYKFQRFGDQAQKCYCGSANCRGYIGQSKQSSNTLKVSTPSRRDPGSPRSPRERRRGRQRLMSDADNAFEKEVYSIVGSSWRLRDSVQVLALSRIMLQAETPSQRIMLLQVLLATGDAGCLKKFLSLHGLGLLWSWMVDSGDKDTEDVIQFRVQILQVLDHLPLTTRNQLEESKLLPVVKKWREKPVSKLKPRTQPHYDKNDVLDKGQSSSTQSDDQLEGTVVTEADSALCEGVVSEGSEVIEVVPEGSEVIGNKLEEGGSGCEAEARELSSDHSQDEGTGERDKLASLAETLVEKWEGLKEVFRIPKRTPQAKRSSAEPEDSSNEGGVTDGDLSEEAPLPPRKRIKTRREISPELTWSRRRKGSLHNPRHSSRSSKLSRESNSTYTPSTPPQPRTPPMYSSGFSSGAPVQNTVIVQHPGQSVYVQQQVFKDGCQTTIVPAHYIPQTPPTSRPQQYVQVQPSAGLLVPPSHTGATHSSPLTYSQQLLTQHTGTLQQQYPGYMQQPTGLQGSAATGLQSVQESGLVNSQQYVQFATNAQHVYLPSQPQVSTKSLIDVQPSTSSVIQASALSLAPLPPPPPEEEGLNLPTNWKTARDANGKVYYYHVITRKTQWERPTDQDAEGTITMDLGTPEPDSEPEEASEVKGPRTPTDEGQPRTPDETPPLSPVYTMTGPCTPPLSSPHSPTTPHTCQSKSPTASPPHSPTTSTPHTPHSPTASPPHSPATSTPHTLHSPTTSTPHTPHSPTASPPHSPTTSTPHTPHSLTASPPYATTPQTPALLVGHTAHTPPTPVVSEQTTNLVKYNSESRVSDSHPPESDSNVPDHIPIPEAIGRSALLSQEFTSTPPQLSPVTTTQPPLDQTEHIDIGQRSPVRKKHRKEGKSRSKEYILKEAFRHKLSKVVTHCLDQHRKPDCKYGRITCVEDFKYLARRLSHGLTEKEITRKGGVDKVVVTDSVKAKTKDYIRQYMKKIGPIYVRSP